MSHLVGSKEPCLIQEKLQLTTSSPKEQSTTYVSLLPQQGCECRWTDSLAMFLKNLHSRFVRRLYLEHLPKGASAASDMDDAEEDNDEEGALAGAFLPHCQISSWSTAQVYAARASKSLCAAGIKMRCCSVKASD